VSDLVERFRRRDAPQVQVIIEAPLMRLASICLSAAPRRVRNSSSFARANSRRSAGPHPHQVHQLVLCRLAVLPSIGGQPHHEPVRFRIEICRRRQAPSRCAAKQCQAEKGDHPRPARQVRSVIASRARVRRRSSYSPPCRRSIADDLLWAPTARAMPRQLIRPPQGPVPCPLKYRQALRHRAGPLHHTREFRTGATAGAPAALCAFG